MGTVSSPSEQTGTFENIEFQVTPGDEGGWYWQVIRGREVFLRGAADTESAARKEAGDAARKAKLIP